MKKNIVITKMPVGSRGDAMRTISAVYQDDECININIHDTESIVGNIYLGRTDNIIKNINSAFVSIEKNNTCYYSLNENKRHYFFNPKNNTALNQGDSILVQVKKAASKSKPATVSSKIELSGYYIVLSLDVDGVLISKKIKDSDIANQLRFSLNSLLEQKSSTDEARTSKNICPGLIIRSNAALLTDITPAVNEAEMLIDMFLTLYKQALYTKAPTCLLQADNGYLNVINDMPLNELGQIITDDPDIFRIISERYADIFPKEKIILRLYEDNLLPLYSLYDIKKQFDTALSRRIWLKCGGYIIIDYTEAMTVIDVNSGRYVTKKHDAMAKENAFYLVNAQAAKEIASQLRLRNISGIVIVDFINMEDSQNMTKILNILKEEFKKDPVTTNVVDTTRLGLVEITRKRTGAMLKEIINGRAADEEL